MVTHKKVTKNFVESVAYLFRPQFKLFLDFSAPMVTHKKVTKNFVESVAYLFRPQFKLFQISRITILRK
jgi:hypothetical protein